MLDRKSSTLYSEVLLELVVWLVSIVLSLAHVLFVWLGRYLESKPFRLDDLISEGHFLLFATTFVTVSYASPFVKLVNARATASLVLLGIATGGIATISFVAYARIIDGLATEPDPVRQLSMVAFICSVGTSLCLKLRSLRV